MAKPKIIDTELLESAGLVPSVKTNKKNIFRDRTLKTSVKRALRILDEQNAVNRYTWYNLPSGLDGQKLERILYYRGQASFFFLPSLGQFYFLPYSLSGTINVYGEFMGITPLSFNGSTTDRDEQGKLKAFIPGMVKTPQYVVPFEVTQEIFEDGCVLLSDYTKQISQTVIPRAELQDDILDMMSEALPLANTALVASTGIKGVKVTDEGQAGEVTRAAIKTHDAALNGLPWIPITAMSEFQDLTTSNNGSRIEDYLLYMQSLDNFRLSLYGLDSGGLFQKKSHMLEAEQQMNAGRAKSAYQDGLTIRQKFCDIVNSIWGLGIWVEPSETIIGDKNYDGMVYDDIHDSKQESEAMMSQIGGYDVGEE